MSRTPASRDSGDGEDRRDKRIGRSDHFIAGPEPVRAQRDLDGVEPRADTDRVLRADVRG